MTKRSNLAATAAALLAATFLAQPVLAAGGVAIALGPKHPAAAAVLLGGNVTLASTVLKEQADFGVIAARMGQSDADAAGAKPAAAPDVSGAKTARGGAVSGG